MGGSGEAEREGPAPRMQAAGGLEAKAGVLSLEEGPQGGVSGQKASASPAEQLVREGAGVGTLVNFSEKLLP